MHALHSPASQIIPTMDLYKLFDFLVILKESIKLHCKNAKLMVQVIALSLLLSSIFFLVSDFSWFSLMRHILAKESLFPISSPSDDEFSHVLTLFLSLIFSYFSITFLSTISTIIVSSESHNNNTLSLKDLSLRIAKSWTRLLITGFYTSILVHGYVFFVLVMASPLLASTTIYNLGENITWICVLGYGYYLYLSSENIAWICVLGYGYYLYLSSVWILGLVVSVVDEKQICGLEALGRSGKIIRGQKISGFLLNVVFDLISLGVYLISVKIGGEELVELFLVSGSCLVTILKFGAYTVLYFRGEEGHGREIELNLSNFEYGKLGTRGRLVDGV